MEVIIPSMMKFYVEPEIRNVQLAGLGIETCPENMLGDRSRMLAGKVSKNMEGDMVELEQTVMTRGMGGIKREVYIDCWTREVITKVSVLIITHSRLISDSKASVVITMVTNILDSTEYSFQAMCFLRIS